MDKSINKCTYSGFIDMQPGKKFECPACGLTITAMLRDGRAWVGKHARKARLGAHSYQLVEK